MWITAEASQLASFCLHCRLQPEWFLGDAKLIRFLSSLILLTALSLPSGQNPNPSSGFKVLLRVPSFLPLSLASDNSPALLPPS